MKDIRWTTAVVFSRGLKERPEQRCEEVKKLVEAGEKISMTAFCLNERNGRTDMGEIPMLYPKSSNDFMGDPFIFSTMWETSEIKKMERRDGFWDVETSSGYRIYRIIGE